MKITWLDDNPFLYDLRPKKSPVISTPKEFSSIRNSEYLGLELWNQALIGSGTDVIFHIRDKKFHAHLCVLNIHSENSVFKKMFDQSKYSKWVPPGIELSFTPEMKIFEVLFKFLYTGRIDSDLHLEQWIELHMLAYVYAISSLKEMTLHLIKQCIKDVKDEKNFKTLLEVTYKYKSIETKIPLILLKHLNKEEDSNLIKKVKDNQMLKSFQRIAIDKTLTNAVFHLTAKILSNLDAL